MSLDVYLSKKVIVPPVPAYEKEEEIYSANITHNLGKMAIEAGIYEALWRPDELFKRKEIKAGELIPLLEAGLEKLKADPKHFEQFNASNGWGVYKDFVPFVERYLEACIEDPDADVQVSR